MAEPAPEPVDSPLPVPPEPYPVGQIPLAPVNRERAEPPPGKTGLLSIYDPTKPETDNIVDMFRSLAGMGRAQPTALAAEDIHARDYAAAQPTAFSRALLTIVHPEFEIAAGMQQQVPSQGFPNKPNPATGTLLEGIKAGFSEDTLLGVWLEHSKLRDSVEAAYGSMKPVPGYSVFNDPRSQTPEIKADLWRYFDVQSPAEFEFRIQQNDLRRINELEASISGPAWQLGRMAGGLADPTLLVGSEVGLARMASRGAASISIWGRIGRSLEMAAVNASQTFMIEAAKAEISGSFAADGLSDAMKLSAVLGAGAGMLTRGAERYTLFGDHERARGRPGDGNYKGLVESAPEHPIGAGNSMLIPEGSSAGAAGTPYAAQSHLMDALKSEGLKGIFGLEKFGLTPVIRGLASASLLVRQTMAELADLGGLKQNKNVDAVLSPAQKTAFPVEAEVAVRWKSLASTTEETVRSQWMLGRTTMSEEASKEMLPFLKEQLMSWLRGDGNLKFHEFDQRVGRAVANGNVDKVTDAYSPFVEKAARATDDLHKAHGKAADEMGMFKQAWDKQIRETRMELAATIKRGGDDKRVNQLEARLEKMEKLAKNGPMVNTGPNYFPRMSRQDELVSREGEYLAILEAHFRRGGMSPADARAAAAATHAEQTLSNFRPVIDEQGALIKAAADPGSLKFRTLEIPDEEIESFLDWSAIGSIRHATATLAPAIELTRRYGDASMSDLLREIQNEYEGMIGKTTSGTRRVELQNAMKQDLEDVQAIRDRLLNVAGASKDPHSWNERTIRMLKHYTAWTTLGLSAISQMGDFFRPAIVEGLDATHRYGFMSLIDGSRATIMKMAQSERVLAGDSLELATASHSLAFSNIGDTYASRSTLERQANQLSGAYFMLNGLTFVTDMTKRWASVIVQGNLNAEIMKWGKLVEEDAAIAGRSVNDIIAGHLRTVDDTRIPTRQEFEEMARQGKLQKHEGPTDPRTPSAAELDAVGANPKTSEDWMEFGRLYGYSENDIAHFYANHESFDSGEDAYNAYVHSLRESRVPKHGEAPELPPVPDGHVRVFHGGGQDPATFAETHVAATHDYAAGRAGADNVWYADVPADSPWLKKVAGTDQVQNSIAPAGVEFKKVPGPAAPAVAAAGGIASAAEAAASPSKVMLERLHSLSIDANDAYAIYKMLGTHGVDFKSIKMANSDAWTDKDAQLLYRGAVGRALNVNVITPGAVDRPTWMTSSVGSLIGQFKAFGMASTIRTLYAGLQNNDRQFWIGLGVLTGSGIVLNELRNQLFYGKSTFDQPYLGVLADGLDRSGALGAVMDVNNAVETATRNKVGLRPLVGSAKNTPVTPEKFVGTFFGPAAGKATEAASILGQVVSGNADAKTWRQSRGFLPGHNLPFVDPIADLAFPKPAPQRRAKSGKATQDAFMEKAG